MDTLKFAGPLHHEPYEATDFTKVKFPSPFVVLVAGGNKGIGLGTARVFAAAGASDIIITGRSQANLDSAAKEIKEETPSANVVTYACDVTQESDVARLADSVAARFKRLDVLIISAGGGPARFVRESTGLEDWPATFPEQSCADFQRVLALNVDGPFSLLHYFVPLLKKTAENLSSDHAATGAPAVVLFSSIAAFFLDPKMMAMSYSLAKFGSTRLIQHLDVTHGPSSASSESSAETVGIRAYAIQPGSVNTSGALATIPLGKGWEALLRDDVQLAGAFSMWLVKERRDWLSGRYLDCRWDVDALLAKRKEIEEKDLLKAKLALE